MSLPKKPTGHTATDKHSAHPGAGHPTPSDPEDLLDDALEHTFPASDPIAERPAPDQPLDPEEQAQEDLLDCAVELTFPASDPIAVEATPSRGELTPEDIAAKEEKPR